MATVIHLPHKTRHGRSGGSQAKTNLCLVVSVGLPPSVAHPEPPSTLAVWKRDVRRYHTPLSSPPACQPIKRSVALNALNALINDGKAGPPVPAFQLQSLYPSPTRQATGIPRDPLRFCAAFTPRAPHRRRLKTTRRAAAPVGQCCKVGHQAERGMRSFIFYTLFPA